MRPIAIFALVCAAYLCSATAPYFPSTVRVNGNPNYRVNGPGLGQVSLLWTTFSDKGNIIGTPAILSDGSVVYGTTSGFLYRISNISHIMWSLWLGSISASPVVDASGNIYIGCVDKHLYVINSNGTKIWNFTTNAEIVGNVLLTTDNRVVLPSRDGSLYFLTLTGQLLSNYSFGAGNEVRGAAAQLRDGTVICGSLGGVLVAIDTSYNIRWTYNAQAPIASVPLITDTLVVFTTRHNTIYPGTVFALGMDGTLRWFQNTTAGSLDTQPIQGPDGQIYVGGSDGKMYSFQVDGTPQWRFMTGFANSGIAICSNTMVFSSMSKYVYGLSLNGIFLWKYQLMRGGVAAPACTSVPSNSSVNVYVGSTAQTMYAINHNY